jgi:hypothetical protein
MSSQIRFVLLLAGAVTLSATAHAREEVPDWSVGVGLGLLSMPLYGGAYFPAGFVSVERKLSDSVALDAVIAGHYASSSLGPGGHRAIGQLALGPRYYFVTDQLVRPSAFAHASGSYLRYEGYGIPDTTSTAYGGAIGLGIDADLSDAVVLRLESPLAYLQRIRITQDDDELRSTELGLGLAPRAELRIGW